MQHQPFGFLGGHKFARGRIDQFHALIAHLPELLDKRLHIPVSPLRHQVVDGKRSAFFQHPQCFPQKRLLSFEVCDMSQHVPSVLHGAYI